MIQKSYPKSAFQFLAPAGIAPADSDKERTLTGIAYAGGVVTDHGYWENLVIDLDSLSVNTPIPLLSNHDTSRSVGAVTAATTTAGNLGIEANLFTDVDPDAAMIAAKSDKGFPWQLSIGIWPDRIEEVKPGAKLKINGQQLQGPLTVFRGGRVREISVVAIGADHQTSATVLGAGDTFSIPVITHEELNMNLEELQAKVAELESENAQLKAQAIELSIANPDPAKFAPVSALSALQTELAALKAKDAERSVNDLVNPALADGRLLHAQEQWARDLGKANLEALKQYLSLAHPIAALKGQQTQGKAPEGNGTTLSPEQEIVMMAMGINRDDFTKALEAH